MFKRIIALAIMVWATSLASSAMAEKKFDPANIVMVRVGAYGGSGVYLGNKIVLTAAHVFDGATKGIVSFPDGTRCVGTVIKSDTTWDQAVVELAVAPTKTTTGAPLARANPAIGETVYAGGYPGSKGKLEWIGGRVNNYAAPTRTERPDWFIFKGKAARPGASGGPVFNTNGEVIGSLWGSRSVEMTTTAVNCGRTRLFLRPWKDRLGCGTGTQTTAAQSPRGRQIYIAPRQVPNGPICQDGGCLVPGGRDVQIIPRDPGGSAPIVDGPPPITQPPPIIQPPSIDYDALADIIWNKIQENPDAFRGPPGQDGPPGPPGEITQEHIDAVIDGLKNDEEFAAKLEGPAGPEGLPGKDGKDAEITPEQLATMVAAIIQNLKQDPEFTAQLQGPPGQDGAPGADGKDAEITADQLANMVAAIITNLKQDPEFTDQVQGPPGPPGADGKDAEITADQLAAMSAAILNNLKNDEEFIAKTTGPEGREGPEGPQGPAVDLTDLTDRVAALEDEMVNIPDGDAEGDWSHLVMIADSNADYWARLSGEFERAKGHWSHLRHVEPPTDRYIGPLPVMVAYHAGKPVQTWVSLRDVSQALSNITRGDYDSFILASK